MITRYLKIAALGMLTITALVVYACASIKTHTPVTAPICSDCHTDSRAALSHTADFKVKHKFLAEKFGTDCRVCHMQSFCSDCHAYKAGLKPSDMFKDAPERTLPHRGDYITVHMTEGKLNPAECFVCHGRKNNERCIRCHK